MKHIRSFISAFVLSFLFGSLIAQQVPLYSQYIMNGFLINPSLAGRDGYTTVNLTVREQWVGMEGSPSIYAASIQTRLLKNELLPINPSLASSSIRKKIVTPTKIGKVGLGGYVFTDNNGIMSRTGIQLAYSYHLAMGQTEGLPNDLSFGLAATAYQFTVNTDGLIYSYSEDPYLSAYDKSVFIPDFNFGASFTTSKYYVGFAMTNLLRGSLFFASHKNSKIVEQGHYFITGGFKVPLTNDLALENSAFIKSTDMLFKSFQLDLSSRIIYKTNYWAGLSWRTNDALIVMMGFKYDKIYFGYSFDFTLTDLRKQNLGTHEVTLAVKFGESARRYRWITEY